MERGTEILVLGIGNLLWADEGFGVRMVEALHERYIFSEDVRLVDGGTQGLYLVQYVQSARKMLVFDALDYQLQPGEVKLVRNDDVPNFLHAKKMSLHQSGFQEVLATAKLTGKYPEEILLIGVQPLDMEDYGGSLTPPVKAQVAHCMDLAVAALEGWGVKAQARVEALAPHERLNVGGLDLNAYESGRPGAHEACRIGDARVVFGKGF